MHSLSEKIIKWAIRNEHYATPTVSLYAMSLFEPNFRKSIIHIHLQETKFRVKSIYIPPAALHLLIIPSFGSISTTK
jgi:hypothetical protein